jgi:S-formylglutathione hydrolase FrmB
MGGSQPVSWARPWVALLAVAVGVLGGGVVGSERVAAAPQAEEGASARLETFELPSRLVDPSSPGGALEDGRTAPKVHVLLPAGYDDHPERRYPVLWLLHGANGGTDTWLPKIVDQAAGLPAVVVMPDGGEFGMYVDWWNGGARGGPAWATYHLELLRETIDGRYRIRPGRRWHAVAGISMGGQGALRYAAMLPGYFGSVAGLSAALPDMRSLEARYALTAIARLSGRDATYWDIFGPSGEAYAEGNSPRALVANLRHSRVYLTSGWGLPCPEDPINPASAVLDPVTEAGLHLQQGPYAAAARAAGADVTSVTTCGVHTFGVWDRAIPAVLAWGLFEEVPEDPEHWRYRTVARSGEMWGLRFRFTAPPSTVIDVERAGSVLSADGTGEVHLAGPPGCHLQATLPFRLQLPAACR